MTPPSEHDDEPPVKPGPLNPALEPSEKHAIKAVSLFLAGVDELQKAGAPFGLILDKAAVAAVDIARDIDTLRRK